MAYQYSIGCNTIRSEGEKAEKPLSLKDRIDPEHLFQAIQNSLEHGRETPHGVTGLTFKQYTITVYRRQNLSWLLKVKLKQQMQTSACSQDPQDHDVDNDQTNHSRRDSRPDGRKAG